MAAAACEKQRSCRFRLLDSVDRVILINMAVVFGRLTEVFGGRCCLFSEYAASVWGLRVGVVKFCLPAVCCYWAYNLLGSTWPDLSPHLIWTRAHMGPSAYSSRYTGNKSLNNLIHPHMKIKKTLPLLEWHKCPLSTRSTETRPGYIGKIDKTLHEN